MRWTPTLGACAQQGGTQFRVWAPEIAMVNVLLNSARHGQLRHRLDKDHNGFHSALITEAQAGDLYQYELDGAGAYPDPASRFQPEGVHGPSAIIAPDKFAWNDAGWENIAQSDLIIYELHIGTFTPGGTFLGAAEKLAELRQLGVNAIELMPVGDFAGERNWGYDGVCPFAPARCYGHPDDLRTLVDTAHRLGLAVLLDVIYNHFGPDGDYHRAFSPHYFSTAHQSPWGAGINLDGPHSGPVREYFIESALHWIHEYHVDGLRIDATHALVDDSAQHFLAGLSEAANASVAGSDRSIHLIAEDVRNLRHMVQPVSVGGWGMNAVWSDDFHHQMRRALAGDADGYFQDFDGSSESIAATARQGWFYSGQFAPYFGHRRGSDTAGLAYDQFVFFLQNHDQIGNRAFGDRLQQSAGLNALRAATVFWLMLPQVPLIFMGQEWAASSPFQYFTDHHQELGRLVTEGRRREFSRFSAFADPGSRQAIPDPQAFYTFAASRLNWAERSATQHMAIWRLHHDLLHLRRTQAALHTLPAPGSLKVESMGESALAVRRESGDGEVIVAVCLLRGAGSLKIVNTAVVSTDEWAGREVLLNSTDEKYTPDPCPLTIDPTGTITFAVPGALLLKLDHAEDR